jgi:hypothetical protein
MLQICWLRSKQIAESHLNLPPRHCEERSDEAIHLSLRGAMDCFAEPVIGRAFARPVGSQ